MSSASNDQGRAYEYAWISVLESEIKNQRDVLIVENSSLDANRKAWDSMSDKIKENYLVSAHCAAPTLFSLEPLLFDNRKDTLILEFQKDDAGMGGDVRDIVIKQEKIKWEIGLSIKHNHEAIKHSRLSARLDFGKKWFGIECTNSYWNAVSPIFDWLKEEKAKKRRWSDISDKDERVYVPLLNAFMDEVNRAYSSDNQVPRKMIEYLIGVNDYYKIISHDSEHITIVRTFNIHGTLNQKQLKDKNKPKEVSGTVIPVVELPTELIELRFKPESKNTVEMYLNNGWQLSFRIHNASSRVEPSLKFDIQFIGIPPSVMKFECHWDES